MMKKMSDLKLLYLTCSTIPARIWFTIVYVMLTLLSRETFSTSAMKPVYLILQHGETFTTRTENVKV